MAQSRPGRVAAHLLEPSCERVRPVEREHVAARRLGIERIREARLGAGRLVDERERAFERGWDVLRNAVDVLRRLPGNAGQRLALLFRLECADCVAIHEQQVVRAPVSGGQHELAHGDTTRG